MDIVPGLKAEIDRYKIKVQRFAREEALLDAMSVVRTATTLEAALDTLVAKFHETAERHNTDGILDHAGGVVGE